MEEQDYEDLSLEELRDTCKERDLKVSGNKDELVARLELADLERDEASETPVDGAEDDPTPVEEEAAPQEPQVAAVPDPEPEPDPDPDPSPPEDDPAGGAPAPEEPEVTEAQGVEIQSSDDAVGWRKGNRKGRLPEPELAPVAPIRGRTAQEGADVKGAFQFAVLPDGRRVPIQSARNESEE